MSEKRLIWSIISLVLCAFAITWTILALLPKKELFEGENPLRDEWREPTLIAHGGGHKEFPDNTLEAFYNAFDASSDVMMETDVSITKDGVVILSRDTTIDRRSNAKGKIEDWNYSDLIKEKVDFSYLNDVNKKDEFEGEDNDRIKFKNDEGKEVLPTDVPGFPEGLPGRDKEIYLATTLEELIKAFPNNSINVEIKQGGGTGKRALTEVMSLIVKYDAFEKVSVASFHSEIYNEFKKIQKDNPKLLYSPATGGVVKFVLLDTVGLGGMFKDGIAVLQIPMQKAGINLATKSFVETAHKRNVAVQYWTIDDEDDMRHLIEINADGIMTNYPHKLKTVYQEYFND